ncbi:hypothetical protein HIM_03872 [Hirsutella minnesotensis 3608]|uniref:SET domain-containing protein n=1 Tax=Hirsutella minnesotensis 3608 TaxID=1043627 RepID=A0A0F7ZLM0_9HYPO|nr:hypothetical protein HIM_03872 [Hirsutella minnesotensis 3608]
MAGCSFAGLEETEANVARAVELLCKIQTNAFYSYDADVGQVAIFLEPTLAMANHSCVPNALVQFVGRKAVLRAERPIAEGDEIEISYTDYTAPLSKRQDALASYCFKCQCPRCSDDLNVYQVAAAKLVEAAPSGLGLVADLSSRLRRHPAVVDSDKQTLARTVGDSATMLMGEQPMADPRDTPEQRRGVLSAQYRDCASLVDAGLWAVTPVPEMVTEISIYYAEQGDFAPALALACLVATECDPYRYLAFFHPARAKTLLMIAKLLANTAEGTAKLVDTVVAVSKQVTVGQKVQDALQDIDQVSLCQMLLLMILRLSPDGLAAEWETATAAREMLRDIEQLPGREKEVSLIRAWTTDPAEGQSQAFFDYAVVQQVSALASLGRAILQVDFGSNARA